MIFNFTRYDGVYYRGDTKVALHSSGVIRLSSGFYREANIEKYKNSILYFDRGNNAIALKFTNSQEKGAMKVTKDRSGAIISAKSFMKANSLNPKDYLGRYNCEKIRDLKIGEVYVIKLGGE